MKKWIRDWALIDFLAFGTGLTISLAYLVIKDKFPSDSAIHSFIPNLGTEIIGAWISIRIIENVLSKKDRFHTRRRWIVGDFSYIRELIHKIYPNPQRWQYVNLDNLLREVDGNLNQRNSALYKDEKTQSQNCYSLALDILVKFDEFLKEQIIFDNLMHEIELLEIQANRHRELFRSSLEQIVDFSKLSEDIVDQKVQDNIKSIIDFFENTRPYLNSHETLVFQEIINFLSVEKNITPEGIRRIPRNSIWENSKNIYLNNADWYPELRHTRNYLESQFDVSKKDWMDKITYLNQMINNNLEKYPKSIIDLASQYPIILEKTGNILIAISRLSSDYDQIFNQFRNNIFSETEKD